MFFEITMIQRLVRFLGYPTYSLTVTLASILVFTGIGALVSKRLAGRRWLMPVLLGVLVVITLFYEFGLDDLTDSLLDQSLAHPGRRVARRARATRVLPRHVHAARPEPGVDG